MVQSEFGKVYGGEGRISVMDSPEITFMRAISEGAPGEAAALFEEMQQFEGISHVDCPHGRYEGLTAIREFADTWLQKLYFVSGELEPVVQTRSGGRSVIECVLHGTKEDGSIMQIPMMAVGDLRDGGTRLNSIHIYFHCEWIEDYPKYRPPVFPPCRTHELRHEMLGGIMPLYFKRVHAEGMGCIPDMMGDGEVFQGGYGPGETAERTTAAKVRAHFDAMREQYGPLAAVPLGEIVQLRMETIIDDGRICCVEWEQLVTKRGREERGRLSEAGMSAYERDENGLLKSVRIIDYAYTESQIDWDKTPYDKEWAYALNYLG